MAFVMKQLLETAWQSTPNIVAKDSKTQRREGFRLRLSRQVMTELPLVVTSGFLPLHHHKLREKEWLFKQLSFKGAFAYSVTSTWACQDHFSPGF